jgi:hypothetical protein
MDQKPYKSFTKPKETMQWDELRFSSSGGSALETQKLTWKMNLVAAGLAQCLFHYPPRQEISKWSALSSTFSRNGWNVIRSASLAKGGTSKKRPLPHLHKVPTRNNKLSPRTFQTVFVHSTCVKANSLSLLSLYWNEKYAYSVPSCQRVCTCDACLHHLNSFGTTDEYSRQPQWMSRDYRCTAG